MQEHTTFSLNPKRAAASDEDLVFDYVIVGAGPSAMGILLGLLSSVKENEVPPFTIAVIERGDGEPVRQTRSPRRWFAAAHSKSSSVEILTGSVRGRVIDVPVGKGVGGTSNINACLCIPPAQQDFDNWPDPWRSDIMSSVHLIQDKLDSNNCLHYHNPFGDRFDRQNAVPTDSTDPCSKSHIPWRETSFPSLVVNIPCTSTTNSCGLPLRRNYYDCLLGPLLKKGSRFTESIQWFTGYEVQRLLFSGNRVVGVESRTSTGRSSCDFHFVEIRARKEVILSAGAIESPAILLASGIGWKEDLARVDIPVRSPDFSGRVGHHLRDHVMLVRAIVTPWSRDALSVNGVKALCQMEVEGSRFQVGVMDAAVYSDVLPHVVADLIRWRFTGRSTMLVTWANNLCSAANVVLKAVLQFILSLPPIFLLLRYFVSPVAIFLLNPVSTGAVSVLRKPNALEASPVRRSDLDIDINLGYLEDEADVRAMMKGWIAADCVVNLLGGIEFFPGPLVRRFYSYCLDWGWFKRFARSSCLPYFHWCGTCAMVTASRENEQTCVVDSQLRVKSFLSLRVCDASVFPTTLSAPPALTCAAMGHLLGSILAKESS
jgi:choline dehydrogenase-like flavoprotein